MKRPALFLKLASFILVSGFAALPVGCASVGGDEPGYKHDSPGPDNREIRSKLRRAHGVAAPAHLTLGPRIAEMVPPARAGKLPAPFRRNPVAGVMPSSE